MLKVTAKKVILENRVDEYIELANEYMNECRKEEGCISFELYQSVEKKNVLTFIELWKDDEAFASHKIQKHVKEFGPKFVEFNEKPTEIDVYKLVK